MTDSALSTQHPALVPDFVVCGNVVRDIVPAGWAPGGTAVYAATVTRGLGRQVGVVTAATADVVAGLPADVAVARHAVPESTSYENVYTPEGRLQYLRAPGSPIPPETVPQAWTGAAIVLLGPVYHEVGAGVAGRFTGSIGVCGQGFLRQTAPDGRVTPMPPGQWDALPVLRRARVLFLSEEDLAGSDGQEIPGAWLEAVPIVVLTAGWRRANVDTQGRWRSVPAFPAEEVDPTGAGDSFAAAFMVALDEGADAIEAARFAAALASFTVEARGPQAPSRGMVEARVTSAFPASSPGMASTTTGTGHPAPGVPL